ncbi:MAG: 2Fe-2S iron-sulfur cluster-binding protein [Acidobacteriota bacterium]
MVKIFIDDQALEVEEGRTLLRAAGDSGIHIPHFCYHPAFAPEGSCRMCLVEIEGLPKLELACSTIVKEGMRVTTQSPEVAEARKGVLEFLLAEHPLDCPICDKSGECRLQDYFEQYGLFESQFKESKEKREKKYWLSKKLILDRERCILCTRCIRFLNEITKTEDAGTLHRGIHSEVGIYESEYIDNNYAGSLTEICPVGANTDADFRFKMRVWLLDKGESICPHCSRGCNILIDFQRGFPRFPSSRRVYRFRARENPDVNQHWICDFGRYQYALIDQGRQDRIVWRNPGRETGLTWDKTLQMLTEKAKALILQKKISRLAVVLNSGLTNEELFLADRLFRRELHLENVFVADPAPAKGDGFLLTEERTPNRRGLKEVGLPAVPPDLGVLAQKADLLLIFGTSLAGLFSPGDLKAALAEVETKVLFTAHQSGLNDLADIIVPTPVVAEKSGTLTNVDGRIQAFSAALDFCGDGVAEWHALLDLAKELKVNHPYFLPLTSPEAVAEAMAKEIPFFKK